MKTHSLKMLAIVVATGGLGIATVARSESCTNTCVTMAIPSAEGLHTKLDGTADGLLWPPTQELRRIQISALNNRGADCNVTIGDVRQDEATKTAATGTPIDDAVNCLNRGDQSSVELRSDRASNGDGRAYHISFRLDDPDCRDTARADEVLVVVPHDKHQGLASLKSWDADEGTLTASYSGPALQCAPASDDRLASVESNRLASR